MPFTVLGDYAGEAEPNWLRLEQKGIAELYQGKWWLCFAVLCCS